MATKGPSNLYGNARDGNRGSKTNHIGYPWAKDFNKHTLKTHFEEHGKSMGLSSEESYAAHAVKFANAIDRKNCVSFIDKEGSTYKFNKVTLEFAIITKDGYVVTYFKPTRGYNYYKDVERGSKK